MLRDVALGAFASIFRTEKIYHSPLNVQIEPTTYCNLKCKMCIRNDMVHTPVHMEDSVFHMAVKKLNPSRIVFAGAGEPALNPRLPEMVAFCQQRNIKTMISTNLVIGKPVIERLLASGLNVIKVSIDAPDKTTYLQIRGKDHFDTLLENIEHIQKHKPASTEIRFEVVLMKENCKKIQAVIELASRLNVNRVYFRELQTEGIQQERRQALTSNFNFDDLRRALLLAGKTARKHKINTNIRELLKDFENIKDIYTQKRNPALGASCLLPWLSIFVAANGDVSPCCALYTNSGIKSGHVLENSRDEILNGTAIICIRKGFKSKKISPVCMDCIPRDFRKLFSMLSILPEYF
jgi:MoaA/NifB/PqqE/SkfB family radical SAM enzyme